MPGQRGGSQLSGAVLAMALSCSCGVGSGLGMWELPEGGWHKGDPSVDFLVQDSDMDGDGIPNYYDYDADGEWQRCQPAKGWEATPSSTWHDMFHPCTALLTARCAWPVFASR